MTQPVKGGNYDGSLDVETESRCVDGGVERHNLSDVRPRHAFRCEGVRLSSPVHEEAVEWVKHEEGGRNACTIHKSVKVELIVRRNGWR